MRFFANSQQSTRGQHMQKQPSKLRMMLNDFGETIGKASTILLGLLYTSIIVFVVPVDRALSFIGIAFTFLLIYIYVQPLVWLISYCRQHHDELGAADQKTLVAFAGCISFFQLILWMGAGWAVDVENVFWPAVGVIGGLFLMYCAYLLFRAAKASWVFPVFCLIAGSAVSWYATEWTNGIFELGFNLKTYARMLPIALIGVAGYFTYKEVVKSDRFD